MITLQNRTKRMRTYNLSHEHCCVGNKCFCRRTTTRQIAKAPGGAQGYKTVNHRVPDVLTLLGGESREVPDGFARVPEIAADIASRILSAVPVEVKVVPAAVDDSQPKTRRRAR